MTDWAARLMNLKRGELPLGVLAALFYFCVLCGYFFLRPVREAMGVSRGMGELRWLFVVTSISSLVVVLLFGGVVSKLDRRKFIPIGYLFIIACLFAFSALLIFDGRAGGGLIGTDAETAVARGVGYTFYVWLSVINLFVNSLFWAYMVDVFSLDQGKRMFAFIGIGGTLGAIVGGTSTTFIAGKTESVYLPAGLMLTGAALFGAAIVVMLLLDKSAARSKYSALTATGGGGTAGQQDGKQIGGSFLGWCDCRCHVTVPTRDWWVHRVAGHCQHDDLLHTGQHHSGQHRHVQPAAREFRPVRYVGSNRHTDHADVHNNPLDPAFGRGLDPDYSPPRDRGRFYRAGRVAGLRGDGHFPGTAPRYTVRRGTSGARDAVQRRAARREVQSQACG